jgi:hypothetical protein
VTADISQHELCAAHLDSAGFLLNAVVTHLELAKGAALEGDDRAAVVTWLAMVRDARDGVGVIAERLLEEMQ